MRGCFASELDDQFCKVRLNGTNARLRQCVIEVDFVGRERLDFYHTIRAGSLYDRCDDAIGFCCIACPVDLSPCALNGSLESQQVLVEMAHDTRFDS